MCRTGCVFLRLGIIFHYYDRNEYRYMTFILLFIDLADLDEMEKHYIMILFLQINAKKIETTYKRWPIVQPTKNLIFNILFFFSFFSCKQINTVIHGTWLSTNRDNVLRLNTSWIKKQIKLFVLQLNKSEENCSIACEERNKAAKMDERKYSSVAVRPYNNQDAAHLFEVEF